MVDSDGGRSIFTVADKKMKEPPLPFETEECSMCGDVGFADQLHQCTRCRFRRQHTYCCNSKEGLFTGTWICDWCRQPTEKSSDSKEAYPESMESSVFPGESGGLECLLKAALSEAQEDAGVQASSADGESLCSSSIENFKEEANYDAVEVPSCSSEDRMSQGEETLSAFRGAYPRSSACDAKRNSKGLRCSTKMSQKSRQKSLLEQQCGSVQLKRLSSMKSSSKTGVACDPPKGFVRRYKSLSDISF